MRAPVVEIARRYGRTPRQVALNFLTRWALLFTIPKASRPEHVRENAAALDFTLSAEDLRAISTRRSDRDGAVTGPSVVDPGCRAYASGFGPKR